MTLFEQLAAAAKAGAKDEPGVVSQFRWATVEGVGPVRVRLDRDPEPLPLTPFVLVDQLRVGDRVRVEIRGRSVIVHGVATHDTGWITIPIAPGFSAQSGAEIPQVRAVGDKVYARGGWSNGGMSANSTFVVGTVPAALMPSGLNALWRWGTSNGDASGTAIVSYTNGEIQCRTSSTLSAYFIIPAGTFWFRS